MQTVIDPVSLQLPQTVEPRNPGQDFDADWLRSLQANTSAIERRAKTLPGRRSVKKDHQAAWLLKAITCIDLTTLSGDDTAARVQRLCAKARQPLRADLLTALDMPQITTGAICVYHEMINPGRCRAVRFGHSGGRGLDRLSRRTVAVSPARGRDRAKRRRRGRGDRYRDLAPPRTERRLASAL